MAHYVMNEGLALPVRLRQTLTALLTVMQNADYLTIVLNQMTNAQVSAAFGFSDGVNAADATTAGNAKAELLSDLGKLLTDASQTNVFSGLRQLLSEFA